MYLFYKDVLNIIISVAFTPTEILKRIVLTIALFSKLTFSGSEFLG